MSVDLPEPEDLQVDALESLDFDLAGVVDLANVRHSDDGCVLGHGISVVSS
jgi:hypothetical protein